MIPFYLFAFIAVVASVLVIAQRNPIYSVLLLIASFGALSGLYVLLDAPFVAVIQIIVYAGAIMVLFVFVVMLLGVDKKEALVEPLRWQRPLAAGLGLLLVAEAIYLALSQHIHVGSGGLKAGPNEGNVQAVARVLFTHWALPFEATSVLLVVAVIGVMVVARRRTV